MNQVSGCGYSITLAVGANGRFSVHLALGTYNVSGQSLQYEGGTVEVDYTTEVVVSGPSRTSAPVANFAVGLHPAG